MKTIDLLYQPIYLKYLYHIYTIYQPDTEIR